MREVKFIRAEYDHNEHSKMRFYWECTMCGKEFITRRTADINGLCSECEKIEYQRRTKENREKAEKKAYERAVEKLRKLKFPFADIPSITVNGEKYYQAKALQEAMDSLIGEKEGGGE